MSTLPKRLTNDPFTKELEVVSSIEYNFGNTARRSCEEITSYKYSKMAYKEYNGSTVTTVYSAHHFLENNSINIMSITRGTNRKHLEYLQRYMPS